MWNVYFKNKEDLDQIFIERAGPDIQMPYMNEMHDIDVIINNGKRNAVENALFIEELKKFKTNCFFTEKKITILKEQTIKALLSHNLILRSVALDVILNKFKKQEKYGVNN